MFSKAANPFVIIVSAIFISFMFYSQAVAAPCGDGIKPCACGDTLMADRTLVQSRKSADPVIGRCQGDGLIIGQSGVTLSLNGGAITGSGGSVGVLIAPGVDGVTIRGGRIQEFGIGISTSPGSTTTGSIIQGISAYRNDDYGIFLEGDDNQVNVSPARHNGIHGVAVFGNGNTLQGSNNEYNGRHGYFVQGDSNQLIGNSASENSGNGIQVDGANNILRQNRMTKLNATGIFVTGGSGNELIGNFATKQRIYGIRVTADDAVLRNNKVTESTGILVTGSSGTPADSSGNVSNRGVCSIYGVTGQGICDKIN